MTLDRPRPCRPRNRRLRAPCRLPECKGLALLTFPYTEVAQHVDAPTGGVTVENLQSIVDQLAQAQWLHDGQLEVHPQQVDLQLPVKQLLEDYRPLLGDVAVPHARTGRAVMACVEPSAAAEILLVLVRNAVDHAPCDRPILIETVPNTATVRVSVHDDGPGVPPTDRDRIFDYGTQLNHAGSLRLGLFIARRLARAHGGAITVDSSQHLGGARFDLTLPTDCAEPPQHAPQPDE